MRRNIPLCVIIYFLVTSPLSAQDVVITEFMAAPTSGEAEWIEFHNRGTETVNLSGWTVEDAASGPVVLTSGDLFLKPGTYLVVTDALPLGAHWQPPIERLLLLSVLPALNNGGDEIRLRSADGSIADQLKYTANWLGERGISSERLRADRPNDAANWGICIADSGATPGERNSLSPKDIDLALTAAVAHADSLFLTVENRGLLQPADALVEIWKVHATLPPNELLQTEFFSIPGPGDSTIVGLLLTGLPSGSTPLLLVLRCGGDTMRDNDTLRIVISLPVPLHGLILNEIMFEPLSSGCEWIEYVNTGTVALDCSGAQLVGAANEKGIRSGFSLSSDLPPVPASGYLVIAADSTVYSRFPGLMQTAPSRVVLVCDRSSLGLGNAGDDILLLNTDGSLIDSAIYSVQWHHPFITTTRGRSLELLRPSLHLRGAQAWSSCTIAAGGTPGSRNSITLSLPTAADGGDMALQITPVPFSPDGDGHEDFCVISCNSTPGVYQGRLRIYDANGRCIRTLLNNAPASSALTMVWNGLDEAGRRARIGPYIVVLELLDTANNTVAIRKGLVVVAARL